MREFTQLNCNKQVFFGSGLRYPNIVILIQSYRMIARHEHEGILRLWQVNYDLGIVATRVNHNHFLLPWWREYGATSD